MSFIILTLVLFNPDLFKLCMLKLSDLACKFGFKLIQREIVNYIRVHKICVTQYIFDISLSITL